MTAGAAHGDRAHDHELVQMRGVRKLRHLGDGREPAAEHFVHVHLGDAPRGLARVVVVSRRRSPGSRARRHLRRHLLRELLELPRLDERGDVVVGVKSLLLGLAAGCECAAMRNLYFLPCEFTGRSCLQGLLRVACSPASDKLALPDERNSSTGHGEAARLPRGWRRDGRAHSRVSVGGHACSDRQIAGLPACEPRCESCSLPSIRCSSSGARSSPASTTTPTAARWARKSIRPSWESRAGMRGRKSGTSSVRRSSR